MRVKKINLINHAPACEAIRRYNLFQYLIEWVALWVTVVFGASESISENNDQINNDKSQTNSLLMKYIETKK